MDLKKNDIEFGQKSENGLYPVLRKYGFRKTIKYCPIDYFKKSTRQLIELKTRRCFSLQYPSAIIPLSKIKWFINYKKKHPSATLYFVNKYWDTTVCVEIKPENLDKYELGTILSTYRQIDPPTDHYFIDTEYFDDFKPNKLFSKPVKI